MAKIENEQVVNRFLVSTTYAILAGLVLYFLYFRGLSSIWVNTFYAIIYVSSAVCAVFFGVRKFVLKKGTGYHFAFFLIIMLIGLFLRYGSYLTYFESAYRRIACSGILVLILYVYEIIRYFVCANTKANVQK